MLPLELDFLYVSDPLFRHLYELSDIHLMQTFQFMISLGCCAPRGLHESDPPLGRGHPDGSVGTKSRDLRPDALGCGHAVMLEE